MIPVYSPDFDIAKIADSGQCFRLRPLSDTRYLLIARGRLLQLDARPGGVELHCSRRTYDTLWREYFDLDTEYAVYRAAVPASDRFLSRAVNYGQGIRILRQEPWEMLITFILSQRKNIPAIRRCVEALCERAGDRLSENGLTGYAFPTARQLAALSSDMLGECSLGYRAPYIRQTAQLVAERSVRLETFASLSDEELLRQLQTLPGVGPKVARCISLFGYHRLSAFPRDVWINRILENEYKGQFDVSPFPGFAGVIQQYMFYYAKSRAYALSGVGEPSD